MLDGRTLLHSRNNVLYRLRQCRKQSVAFGELQARCHHRGFRFRMPETNDNMQMWRLRAQPRVECASMIQSEWRQGRNTHHFRIRIPDFRQQFRRCAGGNVLAATPRRSISRESNEATISSAPSRAGIHKTGARPATSASRPRTSDWLPSPSSRPPSSCAAISSISSIISRVL